MGRWRAEIGRASKQNTKMVEEHAAHRQVIAPPHAATWRASAVSVRIVSEMR